MKAQMTGKKARLERARTARSSAQASERYKPKPQEAAAAERFLERRRQRPPAAKFTVRYEQDVAKLDADHKSELIGNVLLADSLATHDTSFSGGILKQLANVSRMGPKLTTEELNFLLATVHEIGPRDPTETLLACQMAAIHNATMVAIRRLNHCETIPQQDSASNLTNKLARTFAAQMDVLKRYRSSGEQSVRVTHQHVSVTAGQAVVGINPGGGGTHENPRQSHAPFPQGQSGPAMLGHEQAIPMPMPGSSCEGEARMPDARGAGRGTAGDA